MEHDNQDIAQLAASGQKLQAIRLYRERYRVGLQEAKEAVEALAEGRPAPVSPAAPLDEPAEADFRDFIDSLLRGGQHIEAIKRYRALYSTVGLKEAKEAIDRRAAELGLPAKSGCWIATAAYGSAEAPEVAVLRRYRDAVLSRTALSRSFIRAYYRISPLIAPYVARSPRGRALVRRALRPVVAACHRCLASRE
jgi:ribosomal protein L7/L12